MNAPCNLMEQRSEHILFDVDAELRFQLAGLLNGIELLADSQRVLTELNGWANLDPVLDEKLKCISARCSPIRDDEESGYAVIANLARLAVRMACTAVDRMSSEFDERERASAPSGAPTITTEGEAAVPARAEGGTDEQENLQACRLCHDKKTALESGRGRSRATMPGAQRT